MGLGRTTLVAALSTTLVTGTVVTSAAQARVPAWPTVTSLLPSNMATKKTTTTEALESAMVRKIDRRIRHRHLGSKVSVTVQDLQSGRVLYTKKARRPFIPASTEKLATALAVLSGHDADDHFVTKVYRDSDRGRVITIAGGGDPTLTSGDLDTLAEQTADRLLADGTGGEKLKVRYDASYFAWPDPAPGWYSSYFSTYVTKPLALMRDRRMVSNGAWDAAAYFRDRLRAHGLKRVGAKVSSRTVPDTDEQISSFRGHTFGDALWRMLRYSDNSVAELLIRHVAKARGYETTTSGSASAVRDELKDLGIPMQGVEIADGSGLSRRNHLPTRTTSEIVRASMNPNDDDMSSIYRWASIPIAGRTGTLSSRFRAKATQCANGIVMAKTGTLSNVVALAGVATGLDGRYRSFSISVNDRPTGYSSDAARYRVDRIVTAITGCK